MASTIPLTTIESEMKEESVESHSIDAENGNLEKQAVDPTPSFLTLTLNKGAEKEVHQPLKPNSEALIAKNQEGDWELVEPVFKSIKMLAEESKAEEQIDDAVGLKVDVPISESSVTLVQDQNDKSLEPIEPPTSESPETQGDTVAEDVVPNLEQAAGRSPAQSKLTNDEMVKWMNYEEHYLGPAPPGRSPSFVVQDGDAELEADASSAFQVTVKSFGTTIGKVHHLHQLHRDFFFNSLSKLKKIIEIIIALTFLLIRFLIGQLYVSRIRSMIGKF